jgi:Photosynthetic reaction centre cytochrome C subunit
MKNTIPVVLGIVVAFAAFNTPAQQFQWPEEPENLKVLPEGTSGNELGAIMRGFVSSLDVRCEHCHVGEGNDLTQFDFVSDDKAAKRKARVMIEMVKALNDEHLARLSSIDDQTSPAMQVTCMTCHRKQTRPVMLQDVLVDTISTEGVDAAVAKYHELREQYYGGFSFDFSPGTLTRMGEQLGKTGDANSAVRMIELEIEMNGESPTVLYALGGAQAAGGMTEAAVESFTKGKELAPEGWKPFFQAELDKLAKGED